MKFELSDEHQEYALVTPEELKEYGDKIVKEATVLAAMGA
jgi:hypothetical protein